MNKKQEKYLHDKTVRFIEESIDTENNDKFNKEWFLSNIKSIINEIIESYKT